MWQRSPREIRSHADFWEIDARALDTKRFNKIK